MSWGEEGRTMTRSKVDALIRRGAVTAKKGKPNLKGEKDRRSRKRETFILGRRKTKKKRGNWEKEKRNALATSGRGGKAYQKAPWGERRSMFTYPSRSENCWSAPAKRRDIEKGDLCVQEKGRARSISDANGSGGPLKPRGEKEKKNLRFIRRT